LDSIGLPNGKRYQVFRILMVEDDPKRAEKLAAWMSRDVRLVVVTSVGKAIGLLKRDRGNVYAGMMLDHDLHEQAVLGTDLKLTGKHVADAIIQYISRNVPILVHSGNIAEAPILKKQLLQAGFDVTQIPMFQLKKEALNEWVEDVYELWEENKE